jgi:hypothetical protein
MYYLLNNSKLYISQRCIDETLNYCVVLYMPINKARYVKHISRKSKKIYLPPDNYRTEVTRENISWYGENKNEKSYEKIFMLGKNYIIKTCKECNKKVTVEKSNIDKLFNFVNICDKCSNIKVTKRGEHILNHIGFTVGVNSKNVYHVPFDEVQHSFKKIDIYEVISDDNGLLKALYFDIDIPVDDDVLDYNKIAEAYVKKFTDIVHDKIDDDVKLYIYQSMRKNKISMHIIGSEHKYTVNEVKKIAINIKQYIDNIDLSVYRTNSLYRLPLTYKRCDGKVYYDTFLHNIIGKSNKLLVNNFHHKHTLPSTK